MANNQKEYRIAELAALFLAAGASLLYEVSLTKIFAFSVWSNYAYMVISTAMFGMGMSGVILTRWSSLLKIAPDRFLSVSAFLSGITMLTGFLVVNYVPIHLPDAPDNRWGKELVNVAIVFISLGIPFAFFGFIISYLLEQRSKFANIYYCADLLGAGLGSFLLVLLIPSLEPQGLVVMCMLSSFLAAALFLLSSGSLTNAKRAISVISTIIVVVGAVFLMPKASKVVSLRVHVEKRTFHKDLAAGRIEATRWSALSRIDIAPLGAKRKRVWIDGGMNESSIVRFDGDYEALRIQRDKTLKSASGNLDYKALPHISKKNHTVCMIGTSGGEDSVFALQCGARKVVGIEMDPGITTMVTEDYREFAGGLFTDDDYTELIVDEGRSYLRRTDRKFDVIQQVNNFTPVAFANGALNLSESYLLTVESFREFYDHLTDDGILAISRYNSIRSLSIAVEMFRRMGMKPEEYSKHLFVCEDPRPEINSFMLKRSPFTPEEIDALFDFFGENYRILYSPYRENELPSLDDNLYYLMATSEDPSKYWSVGPFDFSPPTDNKPFFNHTKFLGVRDKGLDELTLLPRETREVEGRDRNKNKVGRRVPKGDLPPLIILVEALLLSSVFFGVPMMTHKELRASLKKNRRVLGYFACLGVAFIFIEICLMQRLVLFLGAPVYSISTVLCSLLIFAGLGSLVSGKITPRLRNIRILLLLVAAVVLAMHFLMPVLTHLCLGYGLSVRILAALFFTGGAGFLMGMPMPTGIRFLKESGRDVVPWAWAINGYFTVIGSALSVLLATNFGFAFVFIAATAIYAIAPFFFPKT